MGDGRVLVGVVPNFSEGRRADVIEAIVAALQVPGVTLVYRQADPDHNRLDTTLIGSPDAVRRSALAGATAAVELIDMNEHHGGHPRMGAADVIPFMPVRGISMDGCVELARDFAKELADALDLPVYLYDRAALSPDRASLAEVRRGEFEGVREAVARGERLPDFGPHEIGRAGATAVGARKPLIAFNLYLSGTDEDAAKRIAKAVRESSGGLPAVRAIGFLVPERGCVTVSMNLVDYEVTGLRAAFDAVATEAAAHGMAVLDSEIVGLVPEGALAEGDAAYLRLEGFDADRQVLERLVSAAEGGMAGQTVGGFLEALASDAPTPGGGAVGAVHGATGAALIAMVGRLTLGRKGFEEVESRMNELIATADEARAAFLELADRDAHAFDGVMAAFKMPKETDQEKATRSAAIQAGYEAAAAVPLEVARKAVGLLASAVDATALGNPNAASDGAAAAVSLSAAVECAIFNVEINAAALKDEGKAKAMREEVASLRDRSARLLADAVETFDRRLST